MKIAMWSGPRNLSTALMYSFGNRPDFAASDEPFYAAYLAHAGVTHPMHSEVLADGEIDPVAVADFCTGPNPSGAKHWYQKHMAHHMLPGFPLDWSDGLTNIYLIRHPARVLASYQKKRENPTLVDIGFPQLTALYERCPGPVVDSAQIRANPEGTLRALCAEIGLSFDRDMLTWPAGGHAADGVWARHWYGAVHRSTGFDGAEPGLPEVTQDFAATFEAAMEIYSALQQHALKV